MYVQFDKVEKRLDEYTHLMRRFDKLANEAYDKDDDEYGREMENLYNKYFLLRAAVRETVRDLGFKSYYDADADAWRVESYE